MTAEAFRVLGIIPARGGSKGIPGKNTKLLGGMPLIAYSIAAARTARCLTRTIVSTDSEEIAAVAVAHGGDVPFRRPGQLANDTAPMWDVIQHALGVMDQQAGEIYHAVVLLDPTNPFRTGAEIDAAISQLLADETCDGVVGVTEPEANPIWHSVVEREGYLEDLVPGASGYTRRQDVPPAYTITGALYAWRRRTIIADRNWRYGRLRKQIVSDVPFVPLDSPEQFAALDALLRAGVVALPGAAAND